MAPNSSCLCAASRVLCVFVCGRNAIPCDSQYCAMRARFRSITSRSTTTAGVETSYTFILGSLAIDVPVRELQQLLARRIHQHLAAALRQSRTRRLIVPFLVRNAVWNVGIRSIGEFCHDRDREGGVFFQSQPKLREHLSRKTNDSDLVA